VHASALLTTGFLLLPLAVLAALARMALIGGGREAALRFTVPALLWTGFVGYLAHSGLIDNFDSMPPQPMPVFLLGMVLVVLLALSRTGASMASVSWSWLVGLQAFRIPVEILIHLAVQEGVAPPQLTWTGSNFDIFTAVTALPVAHFASRGRLSGFAILLWNLLGLTLLTVVVVVSVLSMPTAFQVYAPDNEWIVHFPFVYLPMVLVMAALLLHLLSLRKLRLDATLIPDESQPAASA